MAPQGHAVSKKYMTLFYPHFLFHILLFYKKNIRQLQNFFLILQTFYL